MRVLLSGLALALAALAFPNPDGMCQITTAAVLPEGTVNVARSYQVAATGCETVRRFLLDGGTLPPGMSLEANTGILHGQPSAAGIYAFTIRVIDSASQAPSKTFLLRINSALQIDRRILASAGAAASTYSDQVSVSGGVAPYSFALSGTLPPGLTLNPTTGVISGVLGSGFAAPANFSVTVTDAGTPASTLTSVFQISPNTTRSLATASLSNGTVGVAYSSAITLATGTGGTWLVADGTLPTGLSLNAATGVLSGTPSAAGSFWFTVQSRLITGGSISSAWRTYNVLISNLSGLQFTTGATPPNVEIGTGYRAVLSPVGGVAPFTYAVTSGTLPSSVILDAATGVLHGDVGYTETPTFGATIQVTDARGATASQAFTFTMVNAVFFSEPYLPDGAVGAAYSSSISTGGGGTRVLSLYPLQGSLPPGLVLNPTTGQLSGTPTQAGYYYISFVVSDNLGGYDIAGISFYIDRQLSFRPLSPLRDYAASGGAVYYASVAATGGYFPYSYSLLSGTLPAGITLDPLYGFLAGTSTAIGSYSFTIQVTDGGGRTASRAYTMNVVPTVAVANETLYNGTVGVAYTDTVVAQGAPTTFEYTVSTGTLPPGLTLSLAGALSGTPTTAGTYAVGIQAARADGLGTPNVRAFQIVIANPLSQSTPSPLPVATQGEAYSVTLQTSGGNGPFSFSMGESDPPAGLTLNGETGELYGIPETTGIFNIFVEVTDSDFRGAGTTYQLRIGPAIQFSTPRLPNGTRTVSYAQTVTATGGTGALVYSLASGTLPTGVTLNPSTGALSGTPSAANTFTFAIRATDTIGVTATNSFTVVIAEPLTFSTASPITPAPLNVAYGLQFNTAGGRSPVRYTLLNTAPPAILAIAPGGLFGGFPIVSGTYSFTVSARDADGREVQTAFSHTVGGPPILSGTLPYGTNGTAYSQSVTLAGGTAPYAFVVTTGTLPPGLTLNATTGAITGTPTQVGNFPFQVSVTDVSGLSDVRNYAIDIYGPLVVTPATLPNGTTGAAYNATVGATGGVGSVTFAVTSGSLPTGVTLAGATGVLSGTPTTPGTFNFTITATDSLTRTAPRAYAVTITSGFSISTTSLGTGTVGFAYARTVFTNGGTGAVTFAVTAGTLPAGLALNPTTGVVCGTPTVAGSSTFTITATDSTSLTAQQSFTLPILPVFAITTATLPDGAVGTAYSATVQTQNAQGIVSFAVVSGTLPSGLTLNSTTGVISGTPTVNGPRTFTIRASDTEPLSADGGGPAFRPVDQIAERSFTITVGTSFAISTATLPSGNVSTPYSATLQTVNGNAPVSFAVTTGTLPAGLTLNASTGTITGTPTAAGNSTFTITATDAQTQTAQRSFTVVILQAFSFTTSNLPNGQIGEPYSATLQIQASQNVVTFAVVSGTLPPGLTLNGTSGVISGTPTTNGSRTFTIRATDSEALLLGDAGPGGRHVDQIAEREFTITIGGTFAISTTTLPTGTVSLSYSATLETANSAPPVSFSVTSGTLPTGLTLAAGTGVISGTPTVSGTFTFTVTANDGQERTATRELTITVQPRFVITTTALPTGTVGIVYSAPIETQGAIGTASFTLLSDGSLPAGLTLNGATGEISGTPTQIGTSTFLIRAVDSADPELRSASVPLSITINPSLLSITTSGLPRATAGVPYSQTFAATGGVAPYRWSIVGGTLPPNLSLSSTTGGLVGVVLQRGLADFTVRVTDSVGITADRPFALETVTQLGITANVFPVEQGQLFSSPVTVFGGRPPYQVTVLSGGPPPGIAFNSANSTFSGTTSAPAGQFSAVVQAVDSLEQVATATLLFNVTPPGPAPLGITPATLPNGLVGAAYGAQLGTTGGTPPYGFRVSQGNLPPGITMNGTGSFSGTPSLAGSFTFGILATDGGGRSAGQLFTIVVTAPLLPLTVTPESLAAGAVNQPYSASLGASGGQAPYRFSLTGDLPPGVVFTSNATLVGTPTATGTFRFTLEVTDARNTRASRGFSITILGPVEITTAALRDAVVGVSYGAQVEAAGGTPPYTFGLGGLPPGLTGSSNGAISGTPTAAGTFAVAAEVTDARGQRAAKVLSLTVVARLTITSSPGATPVAIGQQISGGFAAAGGRPPYQWAVTSGSLPPGVGFVSSTGALTGAPTSEGSFTFGVTVTDSLQNAATGSATIRVLPPLTVNATTLPSGVVGTAYGAGVGASGGQAPYTFSLTQGELPPGISLGADGSLGGTPSAAGGFGFTIQATDIIGNRATRAFSIAIVLPPVPPISFVGAPPTIQTGQQGTITVQIASAYPVPITGTLTLQFTPNATNPIDDPAVQLTSGGREVTFTIPAGQTSAQFPLDPLRFQVGTVAGQVELQTTFTPLGGQPTPGPTITVTIPRAVPVITAASLAPGSGGFNLTVEGFSNTREVSTMTLQFNPAPGSSLETTTVPVPVTAAFNAWFNSGGSNPFGGSFRLVLPLTVTGELSAVDSVVVRLTNSVGESQPFTARRN